MSSSFWILLFALGVYGLLHSLVASLRAKQFIEKHLGSTAARWYRLGFSTFAVLSFLPVLLLFWLLPDQLIYRVSLPWIYFFLALQGLGLLFFLWSLAVTDLWAFLGLRQIVEGAPDAKVERFTSQGPYRLVRHPMYTGSLMVLWFAPLMSENLLALNLGITVYFIIGGYFEERKLLRQFGEAYGRYQQRTPMLIPRPLGRVSVKD